MSDRVELAVYRDVADVLLRYATGIDQRDWGLFRTCFTDDCDADYGDIGHRRGADEITGWMTRMHASCGQTLHRITNVVVTSTDDGSPGERHVAARSYVDALVLGADNRSGVRAMGIYDDDLVHLDGTWRIARRRFTMVHTQAVGDGTVA